MVRYGETTDVFQFPATGQQVRTLLVDAEPWFVAADVCAILGIRNATQAVRSLDDDETQIIDVSAGQETLCLDEGWLTSRNPRIALVSEPGLYKLIMRSNKPQAKTFQRWIAHDVLPTLRRTGRFEIAERQPTPRELAMLVIAAEDAKELAEAQRDTAVARVAQLAPAARAWDVLAAAEGDYDVRRAAQILNRDPAIKTGQKRLFDTLRKLGMLDKRDIPYTDDRQLLVQRIGIRYHPKTGEPIATSQIRVTVAGLAYLHSRLGGVADLQSLVADRVPVSVVQTIPGF